MEMDNQWWWFCRSWLWLTWNRRWSTLRSVKDSPIDLDAMISLVDFIPFPSTLKSNLQVVTDMMTNFWPSPDGRMPLDEPVGFIRCLYYRSINCSCADSVTRSATTLWSSWELAWSSSSSCSSSRPISFTDSCSFVDRTYIFTCTCAGKKRRRLKMKEKESAIFSEKRALDKLPFRIYREEVQLIDEEQVKSMVWSSSSEHGSH